MKIEKPDYSAAAILCAGAKPMLRTVARRPDLVALNATLLIDEAERLATFDQSRRTRDGQAAVYLSPYSARVTRAPAGGIAGLDSKREAA